MQREKVIAIFNRFSIPLPNFTDESLTLFLTELEKVIALDTENLLVLVDKSNFLEETYIPADLVDLTSNALYSVNKSGMSLRMPAYEALEEMARAVKNDGLFLLVSSAYRSYEYQKNLYNWYVSTIGQEATDRESAKPGTSQHQLGTVVDFGSVDDTFAQTAESEWLLQNAGTYGFSLSFPNGYEGETGYRWESWHYRYIGKEAASFQKKWFGDIQQFMIEFIDGWKQSNF